MPAWSINKSIRTPLLILGIVELLILLSSLYVAAIILYGDINTCEEDLGSLVPKAMLFSLVLFVSFISTGLYQFHQRIYYHEVLVRILVGFVLAAIVLATIFYLWPLVMVSREMGATAYLYALLLLLAVRFFFLRHVDENVFRHRTLVFGAGHRANAIGDLRRKADRRGFKIVGSVPAPGDSQVLEINGLLIKDKPVDWLAEEMGADEIVIAMDDRRGNLPIRELLNCKLRGIEVIDILEFLERESGKIRIDLVNPGWLIFSHGFRISRFRRVIKRIVDLVVGSAIVLVTWPFMLMISLAIKIEDGMRAPVLYRQSRVGYRGEQFDVLKFRSMREDAEADGKAVWAEENDERVTRVGYCLRKFRLDEIPQAFNVISGQMSLVGPRPERPEFVGHLSETVPYYSERHTVKPGVTGWAQIHCPYGASEEDAVEKLQYDLYYVKNHNIFLDLIIILQTVEVVLWGKGSR
jgi:sugar transferase (PEP-CTERM system associated)